MPGLVTLWFRNEVATLSRGFSVTVVVSGEVEAALVAGHRMEAEAVDPTVGARGGAGQPTVRVAVEAQVAPVLAWSARWA